MTLARRARIVTVALGAAVVATGLAVIAGWLAGADRLVQPHPGLEPMPPQAALGFVLAGAAAAAIAAGHRRLGFALAAALGALALAGYLTGLDVRLGAAPDQMAANAALLLAAAALIVLSSRATPSVFQMSQRAVGRDVPGSGAGLAIVRQVAEGTAETHGPRPERAAAPRCTSPSARAPGRNDGSTRGGLLTG